MKQTSFGYKFGNLINAPDNSPHYFHEFALMEAGDDHLSVKHHAQSSLDQVNELIDKESVDEVNVQRGGVNGAEVVLLRHVGCSDHAAQRSIDGQGGCNMARPCDICKVHKLNLCDTRQVRDTVHDCIFGEVVPDR